jgi:hypothetical protein
VNPVETRPGTLEEVRFRHGVKFDGTVNLGHIITLIACLGAGLTAWNAMDKRVASLEDARKVQVERDAQQDSVLRDHISGINSLLNKIDLRVERIGDRLIEQRTTK